jgi:cysteine desulfurase
MIYWDYNANAPLWPEVGALLHQSFGPGQFGNSSSVHRAGRESRGRLDDARARVAKLLQCEPKEVCFTGSGSEADSLALKGGFFGRKEPKRTHIVSSQIEHPAVLEALEHLRQLGAEVSLVKPEPGGQVSPESVVAAFREDTFLCSLMWANNETGVVQPIQAVAAECRRRGILFHTDAVQAIGKVPVRMADVDLLSFSAHKFGGPAGVGALFVRRGVSLQGQTPGHQEWGRRGGTHNVPYIEALALAMELSLGDLAENVARLEGLRNDFEQKVRERISGVKVNSQGPRVPNTTNLQFEAADGEALLIALDLDGICVSAGAACASGSLRPSHVLTAMGLTPSQAHASIRFSLGRQTTPGDVDGVIEALCRHVPSARKAAKLGAA